MITTETKVRCDYDSYSFTCEEALFCGDVTWETAWRRAKKEGWEMIDKKHYCKFCAWHIKRKATLAGLEPAK